MPTTDYCRLGRSFHELLDDRRNLLDADLYVAAVEAIVDVMAHALRRGHKVYWMGNGGSAADAQHLAAEFSGRFLRERKGLASESLSVNTSAITAIGNDFGYEFVFSRQIEAFAQPGDVV
ncbi:MAG: D-sedoheptulose-7-phosphate isomerase, partial [Vulcanimicrobiaceae bacterium]